MKFEFTGSILSMSAAKYNCLPDFVELGKQSSEIFFSINLSKVNPSETMLKNMLNNRKSHETSLTDKFALRSLNSF